MTGPGGTSKEWTEHQRERARKVRARGRWHFIFWRGVVGWGVPTAVIFSALMAWLDEGGSFQVGFLTHFVLAIVLFPIGGIFWGAYMWRWLERQWARHDPDAPA